MEHLKPSEKMLRYIFREPQRSFALISGGQIVSSLGTGLSDFALGVWVLKLTGSVSQFAFIVLLILLPPLLISPLAGVLVDRCDRRQIMLFANVGSAVCTFLLALLTLRGRLTFLEIAVLLGITVCCNTIQTLAYTASISLLVDSKHLSRANGVAQIGGAVSTIFAPLLAGVLVFTLGLRGVLLIDLGTYLIALLTVLLSKIPNPRGIFGTPDRSPSRSVLSEANSGFRHILANMGLLQICVYLAVVNFAYTMVNVLKPPLLLSFTSAAGLGKLLSIEGAGFLAGTLLMSVHGGPRNSAKGVVLAAASQGLALIMIGIRPNFVLAAAGLLIGAIALPIMTTCNLVLLQRNTDPELQGRVLAASQLIVQGTEPVAVLMAGPLADKIFVPALLPNGALASVCGSLFGVGPGRGLGLMLGLSSLIIVAASIVAALLPTLRAMNGVAEQPIAPKAPRARHDPQLCPKSSCSDSTARGREYTSQAPQIF